MQQVPLFWKVKCRFARCPTLTVVKRNTWARNNGFSRGRRDIFHSKSACSFPVFQVCGWPAELHWPPCATPAGVCYTLLGHGLHFGALVTCFKCWLMCSLTNKPTCDPGSKDLPWLPNCETMEQWHLWFIVMFYFLAPTLAMRWSLFIRFGEQSFPIDGAYSSCHKFHLVSSARLTTPSHVVDNTHHTQFLFSSCSNDSTQNTLMWISFH